MRVDLTQLRYPEHGNPMRVEVRIDNRGLTEDWRLAGARFTPWHEVGRVEWQRKGLARVTTLQHRIQLDERIDNLHDLVQRIDHYAADRGAHGEQLAPTTVEALLGLEPRGRLVVSDRWGSYERAGGVAFLAITLLCARAAFSEPKLLVSCLLFGGFTVVLLGGAVTTIEATGQGLRVQRRAETQTYPWREVLAVHEGRTFYTVRCRDGSFDVPMARRSARLIAGIRRVVASAKAYYQPLSEEPAPDTALSRAAGPDRDAERGLSRVDA
jgi:hypothetical protein